ncbi:MAG: tRNA (guanosine(37)-N1)-methyltransferase TrmD [Acidobacteria bacterium]|nr:tRNA (guanosine(37)-N1)-methyltransferase TrmD [Acidobacteriota bacterium]
MPDPVRLAVVTLFPQMFTGVFDSGIIRALRDAGRAEIETCDLRDFTHDRHRSVDDRPYGGGEGMVLKPEPVFEAVETIEQRWGTRARRILLTPQGIPFRQGAARRLAEEKALVLICGRYEGVDQRVVEHLVEEEVSIGDFIVSGGEIPAMLLIDAILRCVPGATGNPASVINESFQQNLLDYPQYTRPASFRGWVVPEVLMSGNHAEIAAWRKRQARLRTHQNRPDLMVREVTGVEEGRGPGSDLD